MIIYKYYLNNKVSLDNVCKILYLSLKTFVDNKKDYFNSLKEFKYFIAAMCAGIWLIVPPVDAVDKILTPTGLGLSPTSLLNTV